MTAALQDMYPKFVETLKDESYYYSLVKKFYTKIMLVDTEKHYRFTNEQRNRINSAVLGLFKNYKEDDSRFEDHDVINNNGYWYNIRCINRGISEKTSYLENMVYLEGSRPICMFQILTKC